jgi:glycine/D-amino acid oxidase-like deaminating enzyme
MSYDERHTSGESLPLWYVEHAPEDALSGIPIPEADVVVIGAGITGLSVAYHLLRGGRSVLVVDKGAIGSGETGRTTAHLANALDDRFSVLERIHGEDGARLAAESHRAAIEDIFAITVSEQIECAAKRVPGYLFAYQGEDPRALERELEASRRAGLTVEMLDRAPLPFATGPALRFAEQGQFDPMAYLHGLARAITALGGRICTGMRVDHIDEGETCVVHLHENGQVRARNVVVATNTPINDTVAIHTKQAPYRSYVIGVEVPASSVEQALYWDMHS